MPTDVPGIKKQKDKTPHTRPCGFSSLHQVNKNTTLLYINHIMASSTTDIQTNDVPLIPWIGGIKTNLQCSFIGTQFYTTFLQAFFMLLFIYIFCFVFVYLWLLKLNIILPLLAKSMNIGRKVSFCLFR